MSKIPILAAFMALMLPSMSASASPALPPSISSGLQWAQASPAAESSVAAVNLDPVNRAREVAQGAVADSYVAERADVSLAQSPSFELTGKVLTRSDVTTAVRKKSPRRAPAFKTGYYICKDWILNSPGSFRTFAIEMKDNDGTAVMHNMYGVDTDVTLQQTESGWAIPAQVIYKHSTYGDIYICPIDLQNNTFNPSGSVSVTVDDNGNAELSAWAVMIIDGQYAGNAFAIYSKSDWLPSNASISITDIGDDTFVYPLYVEQNYSNRLNFYNMVGQGGYIEATITPAKTLTITPQFMINNVMYGDAYCYAADWTANKVLTTTPITGQATETGFTLNDWAIAFRVSPSTSILQAKTTVITSSADVKWPEAVAGTFEGTGDKASPYLIKTPDDLFRMAQNTAAGETYAGKFFALANDIDMASATRAWDPIGNSAAPFGGTLDGKGRAIRNLKANGRGDNYFALFGYISPQGEVTDLNMEGLLISGTGDCVGGIAAWSEGTISDCDVAGTVRGTGNQAGAIAAVNAGTVKDCSVSGAIQGAGNIGSIAGQCYGTIATCSSTASVTVTGYFSSMYHCAGGIVGMVSPRSQSYASVSDSYFAGSLSDEAGMATLGGVAGCMVLGHMDRCFNVGLIVGTRASAETDTPTGGLAGMINESTMTDCFNAGTVLKSNTSDYVGGLIGYLSCSYVNSDLADKNTVTNCYNSGFINSTSSAAHKGIYGASFEMSGIKPAERMIFNCWTDNQITGLRDEVYGKTSDFFTSGQLPAEFSSEVWTASSGRYLTLKSLASTEASALAAAFMQLSAGETANKVKNTISLNSDNPVKWSLLSNGSMTNATNSLILSGSTIAVGSQYGSETVVAYTSDGASMKAYYVAVVPKVFVGDGTETSPYLIKDKNDFMNLHRAVGEYAQSHTGDFFRMTADVDFGLADDFSGVGAGTSYRFGGVFDGAGHTIHKLKVSAVAYDNKGVAVATGSYNYSGLFSVLSADAVVKNLDIADDCEYDCLNYGGAVAGYNAGRVENCRNYADVTAVSQFVGGIVGNNAVDAVVTECYNSGAVTVGYEYAGGITGNNSGLVTLCQNDGDITATQINDAISKTSQKSGAGGITGSNNGAVENCVNNATISATRYVGGLVGANSASLGLGSVKKSVNNGIVTCTADADTRGAIIGQALSRGETADTWFDTSINPFGASNSIGVAGLNGVSTSRLVSGTALEGLDTEVWDFAAGKYPVLKKFAAETASVRLRSMYVRFADGEVRTNVIKAVSLSSPQGITWSLGEATDNFSIAGTMLNVTQPTDLVVADNVLTAKLGDYVKVYELKSIPNVLDGLGTEGDPFLIKTTDDMTKLADFIKSSGMDYNGFFFRLENDLDYTDKTYSPIAVAKQKFQGDFNGNGKTISGITYESTATTDGTGRYIGLFGTLGEAAYVHDLTLDGSFTINSNLGGFAGRLYGRIADCVNKANLTVTGAANVAGFAANSYEGAQIIRCVNKGAIEAKNKTYAGGFVAVGTLTTLTDCVNEGAVTANQYVGGMAAKMSGELTGCVNKGVITGNSTSSAYVAGLVGYGAKPNGLTFTDCHNEADLTIAGQYLGGLLASLDKATTTAAGCYVTMTDCSNKGNLTAKAYVAGMAYSLDGGMDVSGCHNEGVITSTGTGYAAGVVGSLTAYKAAEVNQVTDSWNEGEIKSAGRYNGGFAQAIAADVTVEHCYNLADVTTTYTGTASNQAFTGGFAAQTTGHVIRCWNAGNVTSAQFCVSGFVPYGSGVVESCFNLGDVTCTADVVPSANFGSASGFWCQGQNSLLNSYNLGKITSNVRAAGLHAAAWNGATVIGCYNGGAVVVTGDDKAQSDVVISRRPNVLSGETTITNNYYDTDVVTDTELPNSQKATGLTTRELRTAPLGDAFVYDRAALPTIPGIKEPARQHFYAAAYDFLEENDTEANVTSSIVLPSLEAITFTADNEAEIAEGMVHPTKEGALRVTCTADGVEGLEKHFDFVVTKAVNAIEEIDGGREVESREIFDLAGRRVPTAVRGQVMIVTTRYTDGTTATERVLIND